MQKCVPLVKLWQQLTNQLGKLVCLQSPTRDPVRIWGDSNETDRIHLELLELHALHRLRVLGQLQGVEAQVT